MTMRDTLKAHLRSGSMSEADAGMVADLSEHATIQAIEAMDRIVRTAPEGLRAILMLTSCRMLHESLQAFMEIAAADIIAMRER